MVKEQIGSSNEVFLPFIYALFFFIIIGNLNGNVPYSFAVATSAIVSLGLSFAIFFGVTVMGLHRHGPPPPGGQNGGCTTISQRYSARRGRPGHRNRV